MFEPTPGCRCRATVVEADPPQGSFWVWAVGVYHTFPNFDCMPSYGPAGVLWDEGDVYEFDACTESCMILDFVSSPIPGNNAPVDVYIELSCWDKSQGLEDPGTMFHFYAPAGVEVQDERLYAGIDSSCDEYASEVVNCANF